MCDLLILAQPVYQRCGVSNCCSEVCCMQVERGTTATYLSSDGGNSAAMARLIIIRRRTDRLLSAVSR